MPALHNPRHEKFCQLVVAGKSYTEAYRILYPDSKAPGQCGYTLSKNPKLIARCEEFREEVAIRCVMDLSRKREVLRQMAEGMIPTKTFNKDTGATYDALAALLADARIAGEFAPEKLQINSASDLKLLFNIPHRDVIEAELVTPADELPAPQTEPSGEGAENWDSAPPLVSDELPECDIYSTTQDTFDNEPLT